MNWGSVVDVTGSLRPVGGGVPSRPPLTVITAEQWLLNLRGGRLPAPSLPDRLSSGRVLLSAPPWALPSALRYSHPRAAPLGLFLVLLPTILFTSRDRETHPCLASDTLLRARPLSARPCTVR